MATLKNYGINYLGSKNTIAQDIVQYIITRHPDKTIFIDACCGGFAISHYVHKETLMHIIANDLNYNVIALLKELLAGGQRFSKDAIKWFDRNEVTDILKYPSNYPSWLVGFVQSTWTFGGMQDSYLYGRDKEPLKKALFDAVMYNKWDVRVKHLYDALPNYIKGIDDASANKRKVLLNYYASLDSGKEQLENLSRTERVVALLRQIRGSDRIKLYAKDYREFIDSLPPEILSKAVIYLDPPYQDTAEYAVGDIDYDAFWEFVASYKHKVPIYVSSYLAPKDFKAVWSQKKIVGLNTSKGDASKRSYRTEKLFYNGYPCDVVLLSDLL